ncbi:c2 domain-containing protein [Anaeramoeba flamelloides]|uniref:C2 domain-containing protein n=1 Tax=Anaeramoeba flamelloides TaxID=1746091 RepID=A0AAV7YLB4_9EUKA|nr:c2 domain-containing protein [Anaeramoeba flamelloides]
MSTNLVYMYKEGVGLEGSLTYDLLLELEYELGKSVKIINQHVLKEWEEKIEELTKDSKKKIPTNYLIYEKIDENENDIIGGYNELCQYISESYDLVFPNHSKEITEEQFEHLEQLYGLPISEELATFVMNELKDFKIDPKKDKKKDLKRKKTFQKSTTSRLYSTRSDHPRGEIFMKKEKSQDSSDGESEGSEKEKEIEIEKEERETTSSDGDDFTPTTESDTDKIKRSSSSGNSDSEKEKPKKKKRKKKKKMKKKKTKIQPKYSTIIIEIVSAKDLAIMNRTGTSNPYFVLKQKKLKFTTTKIEKTLNPVWKKGFEKFRFEKNESSRPIVVECWSWNKAKPDKFMGMFKLKITNNKLDVLQKLSFDLQPRDKNDKKVKGSVQLYLTLKK